MGATVHLASTGGAGTVVPSDTGLCVVATTGLADLTRCDVLVVPGSGGGLAAALADAELLGQIARLAGMATTVSSVCTGSMLLGAAGLLAGRRATSHWGARPYLHHYGAVAVDDRLVEDGELLTAAGVTAGIELGVLLARRLRGPGYAAALELQAETVTGHRPDLDPTMVEDVRDMLSGLMRQSLVTSIGRRSTGS